ncbi:hypothetical protein [Azospirillum argentinense]
MEKAAIYFLLVSGLVLESSMAVAQATHALTIRRHSSLSLSDTDADSILRGASRVLQDDDDFAPGTDDVSCNVNLVRSGSVGLFATTAPAIIGTPADWDAVNAEASFVKVVTSISFCGKAGIYAGCAMQPGRSMVVVRGGNFRDIVWAHEFGHTTGLPHRSGQFPLMTDRPLAGDQKRVTPAECNSFIKGPPATAVAAVDQGIRGNAQAVQDNPPAPSLQDLVRAAFVDRVPYSLIARYDPAEAQALVSMLYDFSEQENWANIATALGILGGAETGKILIDFVGSELLGANPTTILRSKIAALIAMGYLLNRSGDREILQYLTARTQPATWETASAWIGRTAETRQAHIVGLSEAAMTALALSGRAEALSLMQALPALVGQSERSTQLMKHLTEIHSRVQAQGLTAYYDAEY